jgi:hypothetical protein
MRFYGILFSLKQEKEMIMKRLSNYFLAFLPFLAAEGIQIATAGILTILYYIITGLQTGMGISPNALYLISILAGIVCGIVFGVWYLFLNHGERKGKLSNFLTLKHIMLFLGLGVGCQFLTSGLMSLIQSFFPKVFSDYSEIMKMITGGSLGMVLLFTVFIAPITEELIFRGVIFHFAGRDNHFLAANIFQAVLFGIYHGNIVQGIYGASLGLLLGYTCHKYQTIAASALLHMIINASAILLNLFPGNIVGVITITVLGGGVLTTSLYYMSKDPCSKEER